VAGISLHGFLTAHWDHEPPSKDGPLTPTLSPSEGERGNRGQLPVESRFMEREGASCRYHRTANRPGSQRPDMRKDDRSD